MGVNTPAVATRSTAAYLSLLAVLLCSGLIIALHFVEQDYIPTRHGLSQYALSQSGLYMQAAFAALALAVFTLGYRVVVEFPSEASSKFGAFLMVLAGFSFFSLAFILPDPGDAADSIGGKIHLFSLRMAINLVILGAILISAQLQPSVKPLPGWGALALALAIWGARIWERGAAEGISALQQRIVFVFIVVWVGWVSLLRPSTQGLE